MKIYDKKVCMTFPTLLLLPIYYFLLILLVISLLFSLNFSCYHSMPPHIYSFYLNIFLLILVFHIYNTFYDLTLVYL